MRYYCKTKLFLFVLICVTIVALNHSKQMKKQIQSEWTPQLLMSSTNMYDGLLDPEHYLKSYENKEKIYKLIDTLKKERNFDITLIFIPSISKNYTSTTGEKDIFKFVDELSALFVQKNRLSDSSSLIILFSINDRLMRIRTGEEVKKLIDDKSASDLLNSVRNNLIKKEYGEAGLNVLQNAYDKINVKGQLNYKILIILICLFILYKCLVSSLNNRTTFSNQMPSDTAVEKKLERIKEITKKNKCTKTFIEKTCIICLEDLKANFKKEPSKEINNVITKNNPEENSSLLMRTNIIENNTITLNTKENLNSDIPPKLDVENKNQNEEQPKTPLEEISDLAKLDCGHCFHSKCIAQWMDKHNKCPICRSIIDKQQEGSDNDTKSLQRAIVEVQTDIHPTLTDYLIILGDVISWRRHSFNYNNTYYEEPGTAGPPSGNAFSIVEDVFREGWNSSAGGATSGW